MTRTANIARRDAVLEQLLLDVIGALEMLYIYIGPRLGLSTLESARLAGLQPATSNVEGLTVR